MRMTKDYRLSYNCNNSSFGVRFRLKTVNELLSSKAIESSCRQRAWVFSICVIEPAEAGSKNSLQIYHLDTLDKE